MNHLGNSKSCNGAFFNILWLLSKWIFQPSFIQFIKVLSVTGPHEADELKLYVTGKNQV
jgi:hypothetical protein